MFKIPDEKLKSVLVDNGLITIEELDKVVVEASRLGMNIADITGGSCKTKARGALCA